ncbi:hypothetical protein PSAC2689_90220 [Paraburkholderia sacchari]
MQASKCAVGSCARKQPRGDYVTERILPVRTPCGNATRKTEQSVCVAPGVRCGPAESVVRDNFADLSLSRNKARREEILSLAARTDGGEAARERVEPHELRTLCARDRTGFVRLRACHRPVREEECEDDDDANIECLSHDFVSLCSQTIAAFRRMYPGVSRRCSATHAAHENALECGVSNSSASLHCSLWSTGPYVARLYVLMGLSCPQMVGTLHCSNDASRHAGRQLTNVAPAKSNPSRHIGSALLGAVLMLEINRFNEAITQSAWWQSGDFRFVSAVFKSGYCSNGVRSSAKILK